MPGLKDFLDFSALSALKKKQRERQERARHQPSDVGSDYKSVRSNARESRFSSVGPICTESHELDGSGSFNFDNSVQLTLPTPYAKAGVTAQLSANQPGSVNGANGNKFTNNSPVSSKRSKETSPSSSKKPLQALAIQARHSGLIGRFVDDLNEHAVSDTEGNTVTRSGRRSSGCGMTNITVQSKSAAKAARRSRRSQRKSQRKSQTASPGRVNKEKSETGAADNGEDRDADPAGSKSRSGGLKSAARRSARQSKKMLLKQPSRAALITDITGSTPLEVGAKVRSHGLNSDSVKKRISKAKNESDKDKDSSESESDSSSGSSTNSSEEDDVFPLDPSTLLRGGHLHTTGAVSDNDGGSSRLLGQKGPGGGTGGGSLGLGGPLSSLYGRRRQSNMIQANSSLAAAISELADKHQARLDVQNRDSGNYGSSIENAGLMALIPGGATAAAASGTPHSAASKYNHPNLPGRQRRMSRLLQAQTQAGVRRNTLMGNLNRHLPGGLMPLGPLGVAATTSADEGGHHQNQMLARFGPGRLSNAGAGGRGFASRDTAGVDHWRPGWS